MLSSASWILEQTLSVTPTTQHFGQVTLSRTLLQPPCSTECAWPIASTAPGDWSAAVVEKWPPQRCGGGWRHLYGWMSWHYLTLRFISCELYMGFTVLHELPCFASLYWAYLIVFFQFLPKWPLVSLDSLSLFIMFRAMHTWYCILGHHVALLKISSWIQAEGPSSLRTLLGPEAL